MQSFYTNLNKFIISHPFIKSCIHFASGFCPYVVIIFYSLFLLKIYLEWQIQLWHFISKPFLALLIILILKVSLNRKRLYCKYTTIQPLIERKRNGYSFPSIHVGFSLSAALTVIHYGPNMGLLLMTLSCVIILTRLVNGSHYISDVLGSIFIAIIIYLI